jgi:carboxyl-terminal processing protease
MDRQPSNFRTTARDWAHLVVGSAFGLAIGLVLHEVAREERGPDLARYEEVRNFVEGNYVREVGRGELLDEALHGMLRSLDPYSRFYGPAEVAAIERETTGQYKGIGVVFATPTTEARVLYTLPGSPAQTAGLRCGDKILSVAGKLVAQMQPGELRTTLASADGGEVELALLGRDQSARSVTLGREELVDPTVRHVRMLDAGLGAGYLAITSFSQETAGEFDAAVERLKTEGASALVLDLRGNLGGVLRAATRIANRFVRTGLLVSHEGREELVRFEADPDEAKLYGMPLVVLVDAESASASEVLAAALQEHRAAVVVGAPTYGKGMVQQVRSFGGGEMIVKLITSYYYTPSHRNLERTVAGAWEYGLIPDVQVELPKSETDALHAFLATYSPPQDVLAELAAWEAEEGRQLYPRPPDDAQLETALGLLRGQRPGALAAAAR